MGLEAKALTESISRGTQDEFVSGKGKVRFWVVAPRLILLEYSGLCDIKIAKHAIQLCNRELDNLRDNQKIEFFVDAEHMSYDPAYREHLMEWCTKVRPRTERWSILVTSRLTVMAISIGNLVLRNVDGYSSRPKFEAALASARERAKTI